MKVVKEQRVVYLHAILGWDITSGLYEIGKAAVLKK